MSKRLLNHIKILTSWLGIFGVSSLIALPAYSQSKPINGGTTNRRDTISDTPIIRVTPGLRNPDGTGTYPYGSRINESGRIATPRGEVVYPNVRINNGDGSTTYYYPNGSRVTIDKTKVPPIGSPLR
jgi:hypothetical protein